MSARILLLIVSVYLLPGCASLINSATQRMADNLSTAMLNQNDPETVKAAAPAYLVMLDSLVEGDPHNVATLRSASRLYAAYASAFVKNAERAELLTNKSLTYARTALCLELNDLCGALDAPLEPFLAALQQVPKNKLPLLFDFGAAWAGWIQHNTDDWNAMAQIPRLTAIFNHVAEVDETHDNGGAHLYLGVLNSQLPPSVGGKPELGRHHFERALALSQGKNLMAKVLFAEHYARLVFDQALHDSLLREVIDADSEAPGMTLVNELAQQRAVELLDESPDFF